MTSKICNPLHFAAGNGKVEELQRLLKSGVHKLDETLSEGSNWCAVHLAVIRGETETVRVLVDAGASLSITDSSSRTPLHYACICRRFAILRFLLSRQPALVDTQDKKGISCLSIASAMGELDVVRYLINIGANTSLTDDIGRTALHHACLNGHVDIARFLIEKMNCDPSGRTKAGMAPIHCASVNGNLELMRYLVNFSDNGNISLRDQYGSLPLHYAARHGHFDVMQYLAKFVSVNCRTYTGWTPLHHVCCTGRIEVVKFLIEELNANPMAVDNENSTPLHTASLEGELTVVQYLVEENEYDVNVKDNAGNTPLHCASNLNRLSVVNYLKNKADVEALNEAGNTPLHLACSSGNLEVVRLLASSDADVEGGGLNNRTPLHYAALENHLHLVRYLLNECDVKKEPQDKNGITPLAQAVIKGHLEVVKHFIEEQSLDPMQEPLIHYASVCGHVNIINYLLNSGVDIACEAQGTGWTSLHFASARGELEVVQFLVDRDPMLPFLQDWKGNNALHVAGNVKVVQWLVERGYKNRWINPILLHMRNFEGETPFEALRKDSGNPSSPKNEGARYLDSYINSTLAVGVPVAVRINQKLNKLQHSWANITYCILLRTDLHEVAYAVLSFLAPVDVMSRL